MTLRFMVGEVPRTKPFQFADLAELLILVRVSDQVSKADLESLVATGAVDSDPDLVPGGAVFDDLAVQAAHERSNEDCFRQLSFRLDALDETYPFVVDSSLLARKEVISNFGYVYLFLLVCSRLGSFTGVRGWVQDCARLFTQISAVALRASLKDSAEVYIFDAGSDDRSNHFHTDLRKALPILAQKLNALPIQDLIEQQSASGDGGIDLVAVNSPGDTAKGVLAYFGQCAAQQNGWPRKTLEATKANAFFHMGHGASNLLYTPVMYRTATGRWVNDLQAHNCVIIDRLRLLRALSAISDVMPVPLFDAVREKVDGVAKAEIV